MRLSLDRSIHLDIPIDFYCNISDFNLSDFKDLELIDDFSDIFVVTRFNIIFVILATLYLTVSNAFWVSLMLYEKYGEDSLKRSINNQLVTQGGCAMIIWILFQQCLFTWR